MKLNSLYASIQGLYEQAYFLKVYCGVQSTDTIIKLQDAIDEYLNKGGRRNVEKYLKICK